MHCFFVLSGVFFVAHCEVQAYLQWAKLARCTGGKPALVVNMDATRMLLNHGSQKGLRVSRCSLPPGFKHRRAQVSASEEKAGLTYIAFLTHDPLVQPKLPQVLLGNHHVMTLKLLRDLSAVTPQNFKVWRKESSWNNHTVMCQLLTLLCHCLQDYLTSHQVILVLDVARCHFHSKIFGLANRLGIRLVYVPAKLTWLLQPLDTHVFSRLKRMLRKRWVDLKVESSSGVVSHLAWITAVFELVKMLLCGTKWLPAFRALMDEKALSARVLEELGWEGPRPIANQALSLEQLQTIFPRRARISRDSLLKWCLPQPKAKPKAKAKAKASALSLAAASSSGAGVAGPISSNTRSKRKASEASLAK